MHNLLRKLLVLGSWVALAMMMPALAGAGCDGGIGGTGHVAQEGGIGGTGSVAQDGGIGGTGNVSQNGGIGGTGNLAQNGGMGGTGIVGAITGFASICVNGLEVHFDEATRVSINGATADPSMLAVGQIIAVYAENSLKGLQAHSVAVLEALVGPVTEVSKEPGVVLVMGRPVRMTTTTKLDGLSELNDLAPGSLLRVSGYPNARGEIIATRIQLAPELRAISAIGIVASDRHDRFAVGGLPVSGLAVAPKLGGEALVRGDWNGQELLSREEILLEPSLPFAGRVERVVAEGLIVWADAKHLQISGFEVDIEEATKILGCSREELVEGRRVCITGKLDHDRHLKAEHIELVRHGEGSASDRSSQQPHQKQPSMEPGDLAEEAMKNGDRNPTPELPNGEQINRIKRMERIERPQRMEPPARMERIKKPECVMPPTNMKPMNRPQMGIVRPGGN